MRRHMWVSALGALVTLALVATSAWALDQASGTGQTKRSAALGFVAKSDRTGQLNYDSDAGGFTVHCRRYSSYEQDLTSKGYPRVTVTARKCFRANGSQRFLRAVFIDRGEPGIAHDIARLWWSRSWPVGPATAGRADKGRIDGGDIQILTGSASG
jgi:hypothetical protein